MPTKSTKGEKISDENIDAAFGEAFGNNSNNDSNNKPVSGIMGVFSKGKLSEETKTKKSTTKSENVSPNVMNWANMDLNKKRNLMIEKKKTKRQQLTNMRLNESQKQSRFFEGDRKFAKVLETTYDKLLKVKSKLIANNLKSNKQLTKQVMESRNPQSKIYTELQNLLINRQNKLIQRLNDIDDEIKNKTELLIQTQDILVEQYSTNNKNNNLISNNKKLIFVIKQDIAMLRYKKRTLSEKIKKDYSINDLLKYLRQKRSMQKLLTQMEVRKINANIKDLLELDLQYKNVVSKGFTFGSNINYNNRLLSSKYVTKKPKAVPVKRAGGKR